MENDKSVLNLTVGTDYKTSEHAGAGGAFQIASLEDENGTDLVSKVDQGLHFFDVKQVEVYLEKIFGQPIQLEFVHEAAA